MKYIEIEDALQLRDIHTAIWIEYKHQKPAMSVIIDAEIYNNTVAPIWRLLRHRTVRVPYSWLDLNI